MFGREELPGELDNGSQLMTASRQAFFPYKLFERVAEGGIVSATSCTVEIEVKKYLR